MNGKKILSVLFGALTSLGIFLLLALVLTWLVTREMLPVVQAPKAVWAALALAALLGALLAEKRVGQMALLTGVATALVFFSVPSEAKRAFNHLSYRKYQHTPLYLEYLPVALGGGARG